MMKLVTASPYGSAAHWPTMIACEKDFYRDEGIEHRRISDRGHDRIKAVLANNVAPILKSTADAALYEAARGADYLIVADVLRTVPAQLVGRSEIHSVEDLRGQRIGVIDSRFGSTIFIIDFLLRQGLGQGDYELKLIGSTPERYAALQKGEVDAALFVYPFCLKACDDGCRILADFVESYPNTPYSSINVRGDFARQNPELLIHYLKATVRSHRWLYDPKNRAEAVDILVRASGLDRNLCEHTYYLLVEKLQVYPDNCEINPIGQQNLVDILGRIGELSTPVPRAERWTDNSYLSKVIF